MALIMKFTRGFTIMELLISVSIIGLLVVVASQTIISTIRTNLKTEALKEVKQNGDITLNTITRMIQNAQTVTTACSQAGAATNQLTLTNPDGGNSTFTCIVDGTLTRIASVSATRTVYITNTSTTLGAPPCANQLRFTCRTFGSKPGTIDIAFTLSQSAVTTNFFERATTNFTTSVTLRN